MNSSLLRRKCFLGHLPVLFPINGVTTISSNWLHLFAKTGKHEFRKELLYTKLLNQITFQWSIQTIILSQSFCFLFSWLLFVHFLQIFLQMFHLHLSHSDPPGLITTTLSPGCWKDTVGIISDRTWWAWIGAVGLALGRIISSMVLSRCSVLLR